MEIDPFDPFGSCKRWIFIALLSSNGCSKSEKQSWLSLGPEKSTPTSMEIWLPSYMAIFINHYNGSLWTKTSKIRLVTKVSFTQTSVGTFLTAPRFAIFLNTAGGAWDNAKKYIEQGCGRWDLPPTDRILDLNLYVVGDHFPCVLVHVYFFRYLKMFIWLALFCSSFARDLCLVHSISVSMSPLNGLTSEAYFVQSLIHFGCIKNVERLILRFCQVASHIPLKPSGLPGMKLLMEEIRHHLECKKRWK